MSRLDHNMLPAPPGHLLFTQLFLARPSRNRIGFCYNDERAGCWRSGSFGKALYTHTHVHSHTTHTHNPHTTHTHTHTILHPLHTYIHTHILYTELFTHTVPILYTNAVYKLYSIAYSHLLYTRAIPYSHPWPPAPRNPLLWSRGPGFTTSSLATEAALYTLLSGPFQL